MLAKWEKPGQSAQRASLQCASRRPPSTGLVHRPLANIGLRGGFMAVENLRDRDVVYGQQCDGTALRTQRPGFVQSKQYCAHPRTAQMKHDTPPKQRTRTFFRLWRVPFSMGCGPPERMVGCSFLGTFLPNIREIFGYEVYCGLFWPQFRLRLCFVMCLTPMAVYRAKTSA